jgi:hypothetical protein
MLFPFVYHVTSPVNRVLMPRVTMKALSCMIAINTAFTTPTARPAAMPMAMAAATGNENRDIAVAVTTAQSPARAPTEMSKEPRISGYNRPIARITMTDWLTSTCRTLMAVMKVLLVAGRNVNSRTTAISRATSA